MAHSEVLIYASCASRSLGFVLSLPCGDALASCPRLLLAVCLGIALAPIATVVGAVTPGSLVVDFVIGFMLGAPLRCVADLSEMVGELIDTARGQTISSVIDPLHSQGGSDLANIAKLGAVVCALHMGALEVSLEGLARSVHVVPLGPLSIDQSLSQGLARSLRFILMEGMRVSAVWMGAFLLVDVVCALCARVLTGLSFTQAAGLLKMVVTFVIVLVVITESGRLSLSDLRRVLLPWRGLVSSPAVVSGRTAGHGGRSPGLPLGGEIP